MMMKHQMCLQQIICLISVVILLAGCGDSAPKSVSDALAAMPAPEQAVPTPTSEPSTATIEPDTPTPEPPTATPTPEPPMATPTQEPATPTPEPPAATPSPKPATSTPTPEPSAENAEEVVIDPLAVGNPERGREIFETGGGTISAENSCSQCHTLDGTVMEHASAGPSFQGIAGRAGNLVPELSAVEYLRQSIVDPNAYIVEGYRNNRMPKAYGFFLEEAEIDDVIAFLLTQ